MLPIPFIFKEGSLSDSNGWQRKWKGKKNWDFFCITFLFVCFQIKKKSEEPNGWIMLCFGVVPMKISSPLIDAKVAPTWVLEGCCLLHKENMIFAHQHKAIEVFLSISFVYYYFPLS